MYEKIMKAVVIFKQKYHNSYTLCIHCCVGMSHWNMLILILIWVHICINSLSLLSLSLSLSLSLYLSTYLSICHLNLLIIAVSTSVSNSSLQNHYHKQHWWLRNKQSWTQPHEWTLRLWKNHFRPCFESKLFTHSDCRKPCRFQHTCHVTFQ